MESENQSPNSRQTASSKLPGVTLVVLIGLIIALLYIGYEGVADNTKGSEELTNVPLDTTDRQANTMDSEPELIGPEDADTSTAPVPVDLSQAPAPPDESVADASAAPTGKPEGDVAEETKKEKPVAEEPKKEDEEKPKAEKPADEKPKADPPAEKPKPVAKAEEPKKPTITPGGVSTKYTVGAGETFYGIANRYNIKPSTLKAMNPGVSETDVKSGVTKLNVKVMAIHTVGPGDLLRVVAQKYGVSKEAIMRANKKEKDIATRGEKLIIPFPDKQ